MVPLYLCQRIPSSIRRLAYTIVILFGSSLSLFSQPTNDHCTDALDLTTATYDSLFTCMEGSFEGATPDVLAEEGCELSAFRTVWYKFYLDYYKMINLHIRSEQLETPIIRLFQSTSGDCDVMEPFPLGDLEYEISYCITGVDGKAEIIGKILDPGYYYIAISTLDIGPGPFTLCLNGLIEVTPCIIINPIVITGRSFDGPLSGPFFQGEILSMQTVVVNEANQSLSCDFFQGLVPILGTSWDEEYDNPAIPPLDATLNNHSFDEWLNGVYSATWEWYPDDVNYHANNENIKLDFFTDALTYPALKNTSYEPDIFPQSTSLQSACCDPCWEFGGSILPAGWFCEGYMARCDLDGKVRYTYGDGSTNCGPSQGPWIFDFSLPVNKHIYNCNTDGDLELYLSLFSFTDGLVGSWFQTFKCINDPYAFKRLPVVCNDIQEATIPTEHDNQYACPGDTIIIALDALIPSSAGVAYWSYELNQPHAELPPSGYLLPGDTLVFMEKPGGGQGQHFSGWLQAYRSARELMGRFRFSILYLKPPAASFQWQTVGTQVNFTGPIGDLVTYHWDFGDGDTSILKSPKHAYLEEGKYLVQLIVSNQCGADTLEQDIYFIYQAPDASFIIPDSVICRHDSITFSHSFDGIIDSLSWTFEGGIPASSHEDTVTVKYPDIGLFDATLTIHNTLGSDTKINTEAVEVQEMVDLTYTTWIYDSLVYLIYLGLNADSVEWKIGDLISVKGDTIKYAFLMPGIYPVTLIATNECGRDSLQFNLEIIETALSEMTDGEDFLLYPNPTKESIYFYPHQDFHATQLWLQDMSGQTFHQKTIGEGESFPLYINMKSLSLPAGMYILIMANDERYVRKKVVFNP